MAEVTTVALIQSVKTVNVWAGWLQGFVVQGWFIHWIIRLLRKKLSESGFACDEWISCKFEFISTWFYVVLGAMFDFESTLVTFLWESSIRVILNWKLFVAEQSIIQLFLFFTQPSHPNHMFCPKTALSAHLNREKLSNLIIFCCPHPEPCQMLCHKIHNCKNKEQMKMNYNMTGWGRVANSFSSNDGFSASSSGQQVFTVKVRVCFITRGTS